MGAFSVAGATAGVNFGALDIDNWDAAVVVSQTATLWSITPAGQPTWNFTGTGLTYDANGFPTGGTITFISVNTGSGTWNFNLATTPVDAATLVAAIMANDEAAFLGAIFANSDNALTGTAFNDVLYGYNGHDNMRGGLGADTLYGGEGDDVIAGGTNTNTNFGNGDGADNVNGENGNDVLRGGDGDDILNGDADNDNLRGDGGSDILIGGNGADEYKGGNGADTFLFNAGNFGADLIKDWQDGVDHIEFTGIAGVDDFSDLTIGNDGLGNALITMPDGSTITLRGIAEGTLDASDFVFGP